jgi:hypothetical protein
LRKREPTLAFVQKQQRKGIAGIVLDRVETGTVASVEKRNC